MSHWSKSRKRELKTRPVYECRCDERLKTKAEKSTRLAYTWLLGELTSKDEDLFYTADLLLLVFVFLDIKEKEGIKAK